jgi:hypothetical protein
MLRRMVWPLVLLASAMVVALSATPPQLAQQTAAKHLPPLLPRVEVIRALGAPILYTVVDYYWIQTIQAVGVASTVEQYRDIYDYAQFVTELDPRFLHVYPFTGAVIPVAVGRGKWANTEESTRILEKGVAQYPEHVYMRLLLSYNLTVFHQDYKRAAKVLEETARLPGAPEHVLGLATRLYAQAGDFDAGLALASSLADSGEDPEVRELFAQRVVELQLERVLDQVDEATSAYRKRQGRLPPNVRALVDAGDLPAMPEDPLGGSIFLDERGRARSSAQQKRLTDNILREQVQKEVSP